MGITMQIVIASGIAVILIIVIAVILRKRMGGRPVPPELMPGQPLPEFSALDENGVTLHSTDLRNQPTVILFVRGTWCPFCSKQVADLTKHYKDIEELGSRLILITPKPLETTRRVAKFFEVEFDFWLDNDLSVARQLGLLHESGVPGEHQGEYGEDTVWPTSLVIDADGIIRFAELSRNLADRPNPESLLRELRKALH